MKEDIILKILKDIGVDEELLEIDAVYDLLEENVLELMGNYKYYIEEETRKRDYGEYADNLKDEIQRIKISSRIFKGNDDATEKAREMIKISFFKNLEPEEYEKFLRYVQGKEKSIKTKGNSITIKVKKGKVFIDRKDINDYVKDRYVIGRLKNSKDIGIGRQHLLAVQDINRKSKKEFLYG